MERIKLIILILLILAGMGFIIGYINHEMITYQRLATLLNW